MSLKKVLKILTVSIVVLACASLFKMNDKLNATVNTTLDSSQEVVKEDQKANGEPLLVNPLANNSAMKLNERITELINDDWVENKKNEPSYITLANNDQLRYYFGSKNEIGQDKEGVANGELVAQGSNQLKIPNVDYIDNKETGMDSIIPHVFMSTTVATPGIFTSQGLIVASKASGSRKSSIMYNQAKDFRLFEKVINGYTAKKMIYIAGYHDTIYNPNLLVETTMTALPIGRVKIDQDVTNVSTDTYGQFMLGYSEDTKLGADDKVPVKTIGDNRGFYINYEKMIPQTNIIKKVYRLTYYVSDKDYGGLNEPDNWRGGYWTQYVDNKPFDPSYPRNGGWGGEDTFFRFKMTGGNVNDPYDAGAFRDTTSLGDEASNHPADTLLSSGRDSAVSYKNQPIDLAANQTTGFSWVLGIQTEGDGPEVILDKAEQTVNQNQEVNVTGQWRDINAQKVSLYYQINGSSEKVIEEDVQNTDLNSWQPFTFKLNNSDLKIGNNKVEVYAVSSEGKKSPVASTVINVNSEVTVQYITDKGDLLTPPATPSYPLKLTGKLGSDFSFTKPDLLPDYEFVKIEGAAEVGDKITGKFEATNKTVKLIYKEVPKNVTMTIEYYLKDTNKPLKDLDNGNQLIGNQTETVTIGADVDALITQYKKVFKGYNYHSAQKDTTVVPDSDFVVKLYYEGYLSLDKVPAAIDFGENNLISIGSAVIRPTADTSVDIFDTVEDPDGWNLQLRIKESLHNQDDLFKGSLNFKSSVGKDVVLNKAGQKIAAKTGNDVGYESVTWDKDTNGLYLIQGIGNVKGTYDGTLEWVLVNGK